MILPPIALPDEASLPFFEGLAHGHLSVQLCGRCGTAQLGNPECSDCGSTALDWRPASGRGTIHSFTRIHIAYHQAFADLVPYWTGLIELEEGPRLFGRLLCDAGVRPRTDGPVEVVIEQLGDEVFVPNFRCLADHRQGEP
ncbi:MAG: hypothetical protein JWO25_2634 [Alphaproteobacteria bacterium]|nr:hypothetical protein [Alphaproteobacteria bacterium]